jgi:hypothetical protein
VRRKRRFIAVFISPGGEGPPLTVSVISQGGRNKPFVDFHSTKENHQKF